MLERNEKRDDICKIVDLEKGELFKLIEENKQPKDVAEKLNW